MCVVCVCLHFQVLITGASGRTGNLVFKRLQREPHIFRPVAMVRSKGAARRFKKAGAAEDQVFVADVRNHGQVYECLASSQCQYLIICSGAVIVPTRRFLLRRLVARLFSRRGQKPPSEWRYKRGQTPR